MSIRLKCRSCQTAFVIADDQGGGRVPCPKCGVQQVAPAKSLRVPRPRAGRGGRSAGPGTVGLCCRRSAPARPGRLRKLGLGVLMLLVVARRRGRRLAVA